MKTKIFEIDQKKIDKKLLEEAATILKQGGLVAFPTETVYGLGANALNGDIVSKIFIAKGRPGDNPLIVHIHSMEQLKLLVENIPEEGKLLAKFFWPGPLTMIFKAKESIPAKVRGGLDTVGIRMPSDPVALGFLRLADIPVAAPSANISGRPSPTQGQHVIEDLGGKIDGIIISSNSKIGIESTVIDLTVKPALILRPGSISLEEIEKYIPVKYETSSLTEKPRSPGTKYRHYAPKGDLCIIKGNKTEKIQKFQKVITENMGEKIGILVSEELRFSLEKLNEEKNVVRILGSVKNPRNITANLYKNLREFDSEDVKKIYMEDIPEDISGKAYQNRIVKASGGKVL